MTTTRRRYDAHFKARVALEAVKGLKMRIPAGSGH
jgi:hypothetical protein